MTRVLLPKWILLAFLLMASNSSVVLAQAPVGDGSYVVANTTPPDDFLSLRTLPSTTAGHRITAMPNGTVLEVLERSNDGWWRVRTNSGLEGWALSGDSSGKQWIIHVAEDGTGQHKAPMASAAPSFNCEKARSLPEFVICGDPKLARLDGVLGRVYQTRLSQLDQFSRPLEAAYQKDWITKRNRECAGRKSLQDIASCMFSESLKRLQELPVEGAFEQAKAVVADNDMQPGLFRFSVCNQSADSSMLAVAHRQSAQSNRFIIRGWYKIDANACATLGDFPRGNFYFFARSRQTTWGGDHPVCASERNFARWDHAGIKCPNSQLRAFSALDVQEDTLSINLNASVSSAGNSANPD